MFKFNFNFLSKINMGIFTKRNILIGIVSIAVIVVAVLIYFGLKGELVIPNILGMSDKQIGDRIIKYINDNQLSSAPAALVSTSRESGVIKVKIKIGAQEFDSYATKDGKFLFPQAFDMNPQESASDSNGDSAQTPSAAITTSDQPILEAYVVSRCPYGLQMQRAMADAVKNLPALGQYIKARYIGSVSDNTITAMHGEAEAQENLRQICIREEQPNKYWDYVSCQMKTAGTEVSCEKSTAVDSARLSACMTDVNRGVTYAKEDFDLVEKYSVSGSPTIILNGTQVSEFDYGGRSSSGVRSMICAGFKTQPDFCLPSSNIALNATAAAAGFSSTYSSSSGDTNSNADCAAAQ